MREVVVRIERCISTTMIYKLVLNHIWYFRSDEGDTAAAEEIGEGVVIARSNQIREP